MYLKRKEFPQRKIREQLLMKSKGQVEWVVGLFLFLFLSVFLCAGIQLAKWRALGVWLEDTLAASNLASAVIDLEEYGTSHRIVLENQEEAWERYCIAVRENLNLDAGWEHADKELITGPVRVVNYTIYNVKKDKVEVWQRDESGQISCWQGMLGSIYAPDGCRIENTGIYSELAFSVQGMFQTEVEAHKGKLIDVVGTQKEEPSGDEEVKETE